MREDARSLLGADRRRVANMTPGHDSDVRSCPRCRVEVDPEHPVACFYEDPLGGDPVCRACFHKAQSDRLREVLARLVRLKDGPHDSLYRREKPKAWAAAREAIGATEPWRVGGRP